MLTAQERKTHKEAETLKRLRNRCEFVFANDKRCSMQRTALHECFCAHHADVEDRDSYNHKFGSQIVRPGDRLDNARAVNAYLTRVAALAASSRITPKHAAILGYIGSLLVCTLSHIRKENEAAANQYGEDEQDAAPDLDMNFLNLLREKIEQMPDPPPIPPRRDLNYSKESAELESAGNGPQSVAAPANFPAAAGLSSAPSNSPPLPSTPQAASGSQDRASEEEELKTELSDLMQSSMLESMCRQLGVPVPPALADYNAGGNDKNGHRTPRRSPGKTNGRVRSASG